MKTKSNNNTIKKHTIKNMMKDICMPIHQEYCG